MPICTICGGEVFPENDASIIEALKYRRPYIVPIATSHYFPDTKTGCRGKVNLRSMEIPDIQKDRRIQEHIRSLTST